MDPVEESAKYGGHGLKGLCLNLDHAWPDYLKRAKVDREGFRAHVIEEVEGGVDVLVGKLEPSEILKIRVALGARRLVNRVLDALGVESPDWPTPSDAEVVASKKRKWGSAEPKADAPYRRGRGRGPKKPRGGGPAPRIRGQRFTSGRSWGPSRWRWSHACGAA